MTARSIRLTFLALLLAASASAQPLQSGMIVALRGNSGLYLSASANPVQALAMSPNTSGWEQWQYREEPGGTQRLVSFHGTALVILDSDVRPFHGPADDLSDRGFHVAGVEERTNSGGGKMGVDATAVINGRVTIRRTRSDGQVTLLTDTGHGVSVRPQYPSDVSPNAKSRLVVPVSLAADWWTIVPIAAPDIHRATKLQESLSIGRWYNVQSTHGTYLNLGEFNGSGHDGNWRAVHSPAKQAVRLESAILGSGVARPITYGMPLQIMMQTHRGPSYMGPTTRTGGQFNLPLVVFGLQNNLTWTVADPTGRYGDGDRVPLGARVVLRNSGTARNLSADSALNQLVVSTNVAAWEQWTLSTTK